MSRKRTIKVSALNVRVHPHEPSTYIELIQYAYSLKRPIKYRGDHYFIMTSLRTEIGEAKVIRGTFGRYLEIDTGAAWLDLESMEEADNEIVSQVNIPNRIKPNFKAFNFSFYVDIHLFVFEQSSVDVNVSARVVKEFMNELLNQPEIASRFGYVSVDVVADHAALDEIFSMNRLRHLTIIIQRPNPSDGASDEEEAQERLQRLRAKRQTLKLDAVPGESLNPDEDIKKDAEIAMTNGEVIGEGKNENGASVKVSTVDRPASYAHTYSPESQTEGQAFRYASDEMARDMRVART